MSTIMIYPNPRTEEDARTFIDIYRDNLWEFSGARRTPTQYVAGLSARGIQVSLSLATKFVSCAERGAIDEFLAEPGTKKRFRDQQFQFFKQDQEHDDESDVLRDGPDVELRNRARRLYTEVLWAIEYRLAKQVKHAMKCNRSEWDAPETDASV